jgi:cytochrome c oxidase cbb3-type subunit III
VPSDFLHSGWSIFVAVVTVVSLVFCLVLLAIASKRKVMANDNTTGHVWDEDLRELNNPLPRWWLWLFIITVVFGAVYLALYPGLGSFYGGLKWTSTGQYYTEQDRARAAMTPVYARYTAMSAEELSKDAQAMGIGQRLYLNNCAGCHGSDARGSRGFPNLTDGDWNWGGSHEAIKTSITQGRNGVMPPMAAALGSGEDVRNVAHYVLSLSGSPHNPVFAQLGQPKFAVCAACHGADGKGNQALGAPNLTDRVWLHGWGEEAITRAVTQGINNLMPAQNRLLTEEQIHVLGAYVWSLSQSATVATGK